MTKINIKITKINKLINITLISRQYLYIFFYRGMIITKIISWYLDSLFRSAWRSIIKLAMLNLITIDLVIEMRESNYIFMSIY